MDPEDLDLTLPEPDLGEAMADPELDLEAIAYELAGGFTQLPIYRGGPPRPPVLFFTTPLPPTFALLTLEGPCAGRAGCTVVPL